VNPATVEPAGIVTALGTDRLALFDESVTTAPDGGAIEPIVTLQVADVPKSSFVLLHATEEIGGSVAI
jgi:hypothetical protein